MKSYKLLLIFLVTGFWLYLLSRTSDFLQGESLPVIFSLMGLALAFVYVILPRLLKGRKD